MRFCYSRPQDVFLHWWVDHAEHRDERFLLATNGVVVEHALSDMEWGEGQSIEEVLASHAGISSGLVLHVPSLIVNSGDYVLFEDAQTLSHGRDQSCEYYVLSGSGRGGIERSVKVRASDNVILSMNETFSISGGSVGCDSSYTEIQHSEME
jgi:hypothetical protein